MKVLVDSNILIYSIELRDWLEQQNLYISLITKLEVLGYYKLSEKEESYLNHFMKYCTMWPIDNTVINRAIKIRQVKPMSLGDSIIAATAINGKLPLATANTKDF